MNNEKITAWVTKYALTKGIQVVEGVVFQGINSTMLLCQGSIFFHGSDWHRTLDEALAQAELMRTKKIESLRKTLKKMEKLKIKIITSGADTKPCQP